MVIILVQQTWDSFFRDAPRPTKDFMPARAPQEQPMRENF
jgi:virulence-associated protein VagC